MQLLANPLLCYILVWKGSELMSKLWYLVALVIGGTAYAEEAVFEGLEPLQWEQEPHAKLSDAVGMVAEAVDASTIEYNFVCTSGGAEDSGWQDSNVYEAKGLSPETEYAFVAKARDKESHKELFAPSRSVKVETREANKFDKIVSDETKLIPIMENGDKDNRINIVVVNRWRKGEKDAYNKPEMLETFIRDARDAIEPAFDPEGENSVAPFAGQRNFFNAYALWWPQMPPWDPPAYDKGADGMHWEMYNELRARLFLPWQLEGRGWVTHLAMVNSRGGGGGAGLRLEQRVGDAMIEGNEISAFYHEFCHTAPRIGDKYIGWGMWGRGDESSNTTLVFQREKIKWKAWIDPETPIPTPYTKEYLREIGVFEGGTHRASGIFRATPVCAMGVNQFSELLCPLCIQEAAKRTYEYVNPIENPSPRREQLILKQPGTAHFSISRVKPVPDTQKVEWRLNGKLIAENTDAVDVELGALAEYELICSLVDQTDLIRADPPFAEFPRAERRWQIANPNPASNAEPIKIALTGKDLSCSGDNDGEIAVSVSGGKPPYSYLWSNDETSESIKNLDVGIYSVKVVDSEFRYAEAECTIERPFTLVVDARSSLKDGKWEIRLNVKGDDPANIAYQWFNGAKDSVLKNLDDGEYSYAVIHNSGATIAGEITLIRPEHPLSILSAEIIPSTGENNGQIKLGISGGREPYSISWSDQQDSGSEERMFLPPGEYKVVVKDANMTTIKKVINIGDEKPFVLERPAFEVTSSGSLQIANPEANYRYLWYEVDYPSYILRPPRGVYEGTYTTADGRVFEATGAVTANTNGKWVNSEDVHPEQNRAKNDYGSWVRLDAYVSGRKALPLTVKLQTDHDGKRGKKIEVFGETESRVNSAEIVVEGKWKGVVDSGRLTVTGEGPHAGGFDLLYTARHENISRSVHIDNEFMPGHTGNYYAAAQKKDTNAISYNRVGVAYNISLKPQSEIQPMKPDAVDSSKLILWFDAEDMDGDGIADEWERGSVLGWRGKPGGMTTSSFIIYDPNMLNGKPVANWQYIWLQSLEEQAENYQTIIMVYRDHELSKQGTGPWGGVPAYIWDMQDSEAPERLKNAKVWLNGEKINPCATPPPMEFCVATFEYSSPGGSIGRTDTEWEGAVAEFIAYDGKLTEEERRGVEEYLLRKWIIQRQTSEALKGRTSER